MYIIYFCNKARINYFFAGPIGLQVYPSYLVSPNSLVVCCTASTIGTLRKCAGVKCSSLVPDLPVLTSPWKSQSMPARYMWYSYLNSLVKNMPASLRYFISFGSYNKICWDLYGLFHVHYGCVLWSHGVASVPQEQPFVLEKIDRQHKTKRNRLWTVCITFGAKKFYATPMVSLARTKWSLITLSYLTSIRRENVGSMSNSRQSEVCNYSSTHWFQLWFS